MFTKRLIRLKGTTRWVTWNIDRLIHLVRPIRDKLRLLSESYFRAKGAGKGEMSIWIKTKEAVQWHFVINKKNKLHTLFTA